MSGFPSVGLCPLRVALNDMWKEHIAKNKKTNRLKNKRDELVDRKKMPPIYRK